MASFRNIVLIALFFLIATPPRAHGVIISDIAKVNVLGLLLCASLGTLPFPGSLPLREALVNVTCNGGAVTLGQAVTSMAGFLNATFNVREGLLLDYSTCIATVSRSGLLYCRILPLTDTFHVSLVLVSAVRGVAQFVTGLILGELQLATF